MRRRASSLWGSASITAASPALPAAILPNASVTVIPADSVRQVGPARGRQQPRAIVSDLGAVLVSKAEIDRILDCLHREIADLFHGAA